MRLWRSPLPVHPWDLTNTLDNPPRAVATFTGFVRRLARLFVHLFAGPVVFGADILASPGGSRLRVVVRRVVSKRVFRLHRLSSSHSAASTASPMLGGKKQAKRDDVARGLSLPAPRLACDSVLMLAARAGPALCSSFLFARRYVRRETEPDIEDNDKQHGRKAHQHNLSL